MSHADSAAIRYDPRRSLVSYLADLVHARPGAPAIRLDDRVLSYGEAMAQADRIAYYLTGLGIGPGDFVGIWSTRSAEALVAMLGILRAGAAYVPLDPGYASEVQLRQIVEQVPFRAVLLQAEGDVLAAETLPAGLPRRTVAELATETMLFVADWPEACGEDPVCMVFTSGTTGKPKGVVLPNRGLASFGLDQTVIGVQAADTVLHASSLACDGGLIEVWLAFLNGASVAVVEGAKPALGDIAATMERHGVTVTSQYVGMQNLLTDHHADAFRNVRLTMAGGDVQSPDHIRRLKAACPGLRYVNIYGPSETTCISLVQEVGEDLLAGAPVPIGQPMTHEHAFVLDDDLTEVPDGEWGQLAIGGHGVALGYFGMAEKTSLVFVDDPRSGQAGKVYLTGDLAMRRGDGVFEFGGRVDRQVKLGGRRIELDGIEHVLRACTGVRNAVVEVARTPAGDKRIGAVVQPELSAPDDATAEALRDAILREAGRDLHAEMLPRVMLFRDELPVTTMGKPDRKAMRAMLEEAAAPAVARADTPDTTPRDVGDVRDRIAAIWQEILGCGPLADTATFFDAGGSSLQLIDAHARLQAEFGVSFDLMVLFETPQLGALAETLAELDVPVASEARAEDARAPEPDGSASGAARSDLSNNAIAIVGMAARVPGAADLDAFWDAVCAGENLIHRFDPDELEDRVSPETRADPAYVPARSILEEVDMFDAKFFGILPAEAVQMDPQARVFLELCVHALDDAGIDPARAGGPVGVYAGSSTSTYMLHNVLADRAAADHFTSGFQIENYTTLTGNITDSLSTRVAYKLGLTGPALTVHTACSTSLTAIAQAVTALRAGQCDVALAGGVSITFPQKRGYLAQEGGMASPDGLCRPFDAQAQGTVFGHGAGVLVLKPLARALADGDRIEAVIRGVGINNDGADKMSFTAPAVTGQAGAIRAAHADAGIDARSISYVECHGTATPLGDPIEIRALTQAFGPDGHCALGSAKGNIGHLDAGAGVISVIKTVHGLSARVIPPVAHFTAPNPRIDFASGPFYVPAGIEDWTCDGPRRAGVSGFGVGGTNVHLVLEEAPDVAKPDAREGVAVLPLSAKSPEALAQMARELADHLEAARPALADVALTLQDGRTQHPYRLAVAAETPRTAADRLRLAPAILRPAAEHARVAFLFPGQGAQYPGMGRGLYETEPVYRDVIDRGCEVLAPLTDGALKPLLTQAASDGAARRLRQTDMAQPALFLTQTACAALWASRGMTPAVVIGHSIGECAAAVVSGALSFEDGLGLVAARGRLMQAQQPGAMLSVRAPLDIVERYLGDGIDLAAANAPKLQVVAGSESVISALEARLERDGIAARRLATSHAFHSAMMAPAAEALAGEVAGLTFRAPQVPMVSTVTGAPQEAPLDAAYWAAQIRAPVRFATAVSAMAGPDLVLLEAGAGATLTTLAAQTLRREDYAGAVTSLPDPTRNRSDVESLAQATGDLWAAGVDVDWSATARGAMKLRLPGTHFIRKRHWIDPPLPVAASGQPIETVPQITLPAEPRPAMTQTQIQPQPVTDRKARFVSELVTLFADLSGEDLTGADAETSFLELGFDSLFMGQAAQALTRAYGVAMTFRALLAEHPCLSALAAHLDTVLPADAMPEPEPHPQPLTVAELPAAPGGSAPAAPVSVPGDVNALMQAQMQTMQQVFATQLRMLGQAAPAVPVSDTETVTETMMVSAPAAPADEPEKETPVFKVGRAPALANADLTEAQKLWARDLTGQYSRKFAGSKAHTDQHRAHHADPRAAAGFRSEWKDLVFPIVAARSKGAWIEDVDGNRLVDLVNGFGQTAFGHAPDFVADAVRAQLERGYAIGPQSDMAGPVAARFAAMAGHARATFCNTGSEAVMAAMRLARTVTGRDKVVVFGNDYHGQFDEVLVKGRARGEPGALPIAPGIPRDAVANMVVLPYADPASLVWIGQNIDQIAAVVVEPVQSRHPELRPEGFVRELRDVTAQGGAALVMDEVVTGFRTHARGMQGVWDIHPDMATYGKVVGGGMPVGMLAGDAKFMDALDGGAWRYGDDSAPQTAPTFFAGTFVRHPLVVAAVAAVLEELERNGDALWSDAADRCAGLAGRMNGMLTSRGLPELVATYSSWFVLNVSQHDPRATLLHALMRLEGVHTLDGFCGFLTTEHGDAECDRIAVAFGKAVDALQSVGILVPEGGVESVPGAALRQAGGTAPAGPVPLTESMREIWMTHQLGAQPAAAFNESVSLNIDGPLDLDALRRALNTLVARHDALRLRFARDGQSMKVGAPQPLEVREADALARVLRQEAETPFDLSTGAPVRATLVRAGDTEHVLVLTAHHIVCDGWSFNTLATELAAIYAAAVAGTAPDLPPAPSFAALAAESSQAAMTAQTECFWQEVYDTVPDLPELPTDRPRGVTKSFAGATTTATIDADLLRDLRKAGARAGCTLFATLFGALQITLGRLAGANDIVLGVPTGGQVALDVPETVGHLVNFLPIRAAFDPEETVAAHLSRVSDAVMQAFEHGDTTLGTLVRTLGTRRTLSRLPLTEVQFNLERVPDTLAMGPARMALRANPKAAVNYDLFFNMVEGSEGLRAEVDYCTALFDEATVQRWLGHLEVVLRALVRDASQAIADVPLMTTEEENRLAQQGAPARVDYPDTASLPDLIAQTVLQRPDAEAVRDGEGAWSYDDLWAASGALAAQVQERNLPPGGRVGVSVPRGKAMLAALIAVHRAGMIYVPLDPDQPLARQRQVLDAAQASAVIAPGAALDGLTRGTRMVAIDPSQVSAGALPAPVSVDSGSAAYVIFTSGSTGAPKGVSVPHRAVINFLTSMARVPGFSSRDKILAVTTVSFDIAVLEFFLPLIVGGKLEIATRAEVMDGFALAEKLADPGFTVMQATPTLWAMLVEAGLRPRAGLKMLAGGEPLPSDLADKLAEGGELWNMYGPTETTIWSSAGHVEKGGAVTIGDPVANTELHVLDDRDHLCAPGVVGELNIGGDGLAIGYHERPDLTAAAFRAVSLAGQARRLYRTGDLAVRRPDGTIEVLGRRDGQVKLRGYRIEPGEIEARLRAEASVAAAAVAVRTAPSSADQLVAYVVPRFGDVMDAQQLTDALAKVLPDYMVPAAWVSMEALPQTANGKLDRKALPDPEPCLSGPVRLWVAEPATTRTEQKIADIWQDVLGLDTLSVTDTIFALGADSLSVFRIAAQMMRAGLPLEARHVMEYGSVRALAEFADRVTPETPVRPSLSDFRRVSRTGT